MKVRVTVGCKLGEEPAVTVIEYPVCVPELTTKLAPAPHPENEKFPDVRGTPGAVTKDVGMLITTQSGRLSITVVGPFSEVITVAIGITWEGKPVVLDWITFDTVL